MNIAIVNQFTKEAIKSRMVQHAANLWGVKNPNALDPLVRLLIEAFSTEIFRAANETHNIESRILDKIAHILTPNLLAASKPAHAVMQARPSSGEYLLHPHTRFSIPKKLSQNVTSAIKNDEVQINFSPTTATKLFKGSLGFIANGYQVFSVDHAGFKQPILRTNTPLPWSGCWLGIQMDAHVTNLNQLSIYFDFPAYESSSWIYQLLPLAKLFYKNRPVAIRQGITSYKNESEVIDTGHEIFHYRDVMNQLRQEVEQYYSSRFITVENCVLDEEQEDYPEEIKKCFDDTVLAGKIPQGLIWLKIVFPSNFNYEVLSNSFIAINCFPVANWSLITNFYSYKGLNSIFPLRTEVHERFMAVYQVADMQGRLYTELPYNQSLKGQTGYYTVRQGGVERFDQRSANDMISYLLELTRDEVAAFSSLDQTFIRTSLEALSRQLKQIENKVNVMDKFIHQSPNYLVIEPFDADDNIQVDYWVTHGSEANHIRPGIEFHCQNNPDIDPRGIVLVSESVGGREPLQAGERLNMYRYALSSKNRLITPEDIRNFCKVELGNHIQDVEFSKGLEASPHPKQGYVRVTIIHLIPKDANTLTANNWKELADKLLVKIKNLSPEGTNYKVVIGKA